ncbi:uncharacterized protein LOC110374869 [Helicoverpa armigera]|uniref:uncharacterized protein LOC110374869 n=1 Tax=Helicoverpa armigera TaxID=29058 RepID=UPI00308377AD
MTLRTPRRRISPRTKRRYRAIREFFRRALGTTSQPDIKISSSIALNVTDLKRKIVGLEQQLDEVNKQESDVYFQQNTPHERESNSYIPLDVKREIDTINEQTESSYDRKLNGIETKFIYKSSEGNYKYEDSEYHQKPHDVNDSNATQDMVDEFEGHISKVKNKKSKLPKAAEYGAKLHKHRTRSVYENIASPNTTSSFHSLADPRMNHISTNPGYSGHPPDKNYYINEYAGPEPPSLHKEKKYRENVKKNKVDLYKEAYDQKPSKIRKQKHHNRELDQDFIADIIRRQYKPVTMFGKRESEISQISAPVCRDQEYPIRDEIQEGTELCSCCYDDKKHKLRQCELGEMRSICDTRLYSSKKRPRRKHRRVHVDMFNNSDLYDLIPVKEKSSPKSRRKFTDDNMIAYEYYREVPPSPRTQRPRLNLKAQCNADFQDCMAQVKNSCRKGSPHRQRRQQVLVEPESDITTEPVVAVKEPRKIHKHMKCQVEKEELCQQENCTMSSLQYPMYANEQANITVDTSFNKTQETEIPVDKTDKALCEIKDILQSFLHEIKKETVASQCDKSEVTSKTDDNCINILNEHSAKFNSSVMPNSRQNANYNAGCNAPPAFMTPFQNPCCYPVMPVCPCPMPMQSSYMMPSQSYTCTNCANATKEPSHTEHCCNKNVTTTGTCHTDTCHTDTYHTETDELIKEIYKFVAQKPARKKKCESSVDEHEARKAEAKMLTSRSVGENSKLAKHDAKVGTAPLKCYSKSCEAIGSRISTDPYTTGTTNVSFSDTILEKLSLEVTQSSSDTEMETEINIEKSKRNKFSKVLQSINLFKRKKKKDVIEELSESESAIDVDLQAKLPYRQEITNYMMQGQEYYQPPMTPNYQRPHEYQPDYHPPYNPGLQEYPPPPPMHDTYASRPHPSRMQEQATAPPFNLKHRPTAPPYQSAYENHYAQMQQPQVPLCLREIEVKSIGTQSERKMSFFRKIKKKIQQPLSPDEDYQKTCSTQTQATTSKSTPPKGFFNWKNLQAKAMMERNHLNSDPMQFAFKKQKELAEGDQKLRNAMLKKLFNKRNPFSPRNLIVRTLLGRDKSSFGETPTMMRPRLFL